MDVPFAADELDSDRGSRSGVKAKLGPAGLNRRDLRGSSLEGEDFGGTSGRSLPSRTTFESRSSGIFSISGTSLCCGDKAAGDVAHLDVPFLRHLDQKVESSVG